MKKFVTPDYEAWARDGRIVKVGKETFQIAPENVLHEDGDPWWYFDEAQEISKNAEYDWHLPTPVEALLISAQICYDKALRLPVGRAIADAIQADFCGTGISLGNGSAFFAQEKGERVAFWTNTYRTYDVGVGRSMKSGYTFMLRPEYADLYTLPMDDRGACVRLVRLIRSK